MPQLPAGPDDYAASTATTGVVAIGGSTTGDIETTNDQDWFAVTLTAGRTYQFKSEGASTGQGSLNYPSLQLLDHDGHSIISANNLPSVITYTATSSATYYLAIGSESSLTDVGTYKVSAVDTTVPAPPAAPADGAVVNGYVNAANDTAAQALTGTAEDASTVTVYDSGTQVGTTTANATTGAWSFTIGALADASTHSYTVTSTDAAGNMSQPSHALSFVVDTTAPTVAVSINNTDVNVTNGAGTVTFAFSEAAASFALFNTSAVGGTLSNLQQTDATHYTATFTGAANTDIGTASVSVTTGSYQDLAGNAGAGSSTAAFTVDTVTPTVLLSINNTFINQAHTSATVTFTFSEAPTAFTLADTSAVGGTLSNLQQTDGTHYTATFTGAANTDISTASVSVTTMSSVNFSSAVATFYEIENDWAPSKMIDGVFTGPNGGINGWSVYGNGGAEGADALLTIANPLAAGKYNLTFRIYQNYSGNPGHILGDFALEYTTAASPTLSSPQTAVSIQSASSLNGTTFSLLSPGELLANTSQNSVGTDTYTISASIDSASPITGIFLDAIKNPVLPGGGPGGQYSNGNFVVSEFTLDASIGGSTGPFTVDTVVPTVGVSIDNTFINQAHTTGTVTFAFSEAPTAFTLADTRAVGGTLSNLQQTDGTHYSATSKGGAQTRITNASVSVTAGSWQENNGNPGGGGSTALFQVDTLTAPEPPTIIVNSYPAATRGQVIALSTLVAISDGFGLGFQELELWDSQGTAFGGQFVVKGVAQTGGHQIDLSPADVTNAVFDVGTLGGIDTLWARLLQNDGTLTPWQQFAVAAPIDTPPAVIVSNRIATHGHSFSVSSLFVASDPDGDAITEYDFWDTGAGGGHFVLNGQVLGANQDNYISASQLAQTTYQSGSGTDTLWVRVSDGAQWSTWSQSFTVTAPIDTGPVETVANVTATHGQSFPASSLFAYSDPFGSAATEYDFWDSGTGGGHFLLNGVALGTNQDNIITAAQLSQLTYQSGSGADTLWVRANDGTVWGAWSNAFAVLAPIDTGPVETVANVTATHGQSFPASSLFAYSDPFGSAATEYDFWDSGTGGGHFLLNGVALGTNQDNIITAAQLSQLTYQSGSGADTLWVRANDGTVWGAWSNAFAVLAPLDTGPVVTSVSNINTTAGQTFAATALFTASDPFKDPIEQYDFWDTGNGGGHFTLNGQPLGTNQDNYVSSGQLAQTSYVSGSGTDALWVRVSEGGQWSPWSQSVTVSDPTTIGAGETLELPSAYSGQLSFAADTGMLKLDNSGTFAGTVAGMAGQDGIDFADIDAANVQTPSFSGTSAGGTLTVTDGTRTANIGLLGNYLASTFVTSSDAHGGTNVVDHAPSDQTSVLAPAQH